MKVNPRRSTTKLDRVPRRKYFRVQGEAERKTRHYPLTPPIQEKVIARKGEQKQKISIG